MSSEILRQGSSFVTAPREPVLYKEARKSKMGVKEREFLESKTPIRQFGGTDTGRSEDAGGDHVIAKRAVATSNPGTGPEWTNCIAVV